MANLSVKALLRASCHHAGLKFLTMFLQKWSSLDVPTATTEDAYYVTCPLHRSQLANGNWTLLMLSHEVFIRLESRASFIKASLINVWQRCRQVCPYHATAFWPIWGKERKCKKELSVGRQPEDVVIRMMAWWVAQGFLDQHWVFVVTCVPIISSRQQCWCRRQMLDFQESNQSGKLCSQSRVRYSSIGPTWLSKGYKLVRRPGETDEEFRRRHVMMVTCPALWSMYPFKTAMSTSISAICLSRQC